VTLQQLLVHAACVAVNNIPCDVTRQHLD